MSEKPLFKFWLYIPWLLVLILTPVGVYWLTEETPLEINYVAPLFSSQEVFTREEAEQHAITKVYGGQTVWRYVEYCVKEPFRGTSRRSWLGEAIVWPAPDLPLQLSKVVGCKSASIAVDVPSSSPTRKFNFMQEISIHLNPLRTASIDFDPIPLIILEPGCNK